MSNEPSPQDLTIMPMPLLVEYRDACQASLEEQSNYIRDINNVLAGRVEAEVKNLYRVKHKTVGTVSIHHSTGVDAKGSITKSVKWDSDALMKMTSDMDWEDVMHWFSIKFTVSEAKFKAMPRGALLDKVTAARTTKEGDLKIVVSAAEK